MNDCRRLFKRRAGFITQRGRGKQRLCAYPPLCRKAGHSKMSPRLEERSTFQNLKYASHAREYLTLGSPPRSRFVLWQITATGTIITGALLDIGTAFPHCRMPTEHDARLGSDIDEGCSWGPSLVNCILFFYLSGYNTRQSARQHKAISRGKRQKAAK